MTVSRVINKSGYASQTAREKVLRAIKDLNYHPNGLARDLRMRIREDLAILGFDNVPLAAYTTPPLTTVEQPTAEQGRRAVEFLLDRMEGLAPAERPELCLPCRLIVRGSTASSRIAAAR